MGKLIRATHYTVCAADGRVLWEAGPNEERDVEETGDAVTLAADMDDGSLVLWPIDKIMARGNPTMVNSHEEERR